MEGKKNIGVGDVVADNGSTVIVNTGKMLGLKEEHIKKLFTSLQEKMLQQFSQLSHDVEQSACIITNAIAGYLQNFAKSKEFINLSSSLQNDTEKFIKEIQTLAKDNFASLKAIVEEKFAEQNTKKIENLHINLNINIRDYNYETMEKTSAQILNLRPDDFIAGYFNALAQKKSYKNNTYENWLNNAQVYNCDKKSIDRVVDEVIKNYAANDDIAVQNFIQRCSKDAHERDINNTRLAEQRDVVKKNHTFRARDIFMCHASYDGAIANGLVQFIEQSLTRECWIAHRNLEKLGATEYRKGLTRGIESCRAVLFVMTKVSVCREDVIFEISEALRLNKHVIILQLDDMTDEEISTLDSSIKNLLAQKRERIITSKENWRNHLNEVRDAIKYVLDMLKEEEDAGKNVDAQGRDFYEKPEQNARLAEQARKEVASTVGQYNTETQIIHKSKKSSVKFVISNICCYLALVLLVVLYLYNKWNQLENTFSYVLYYAVPCILCINIIRTYFYNKNCKNYLLYVLFQNLNFILYVGIVTVFLVDFSEHIEPYIKLSTFEVIIIPIYFVLLKSLSWMHFDNNPLINLRLIKGYSKIHYASFSVKIIFIYIVVGAFIASYFDSVGMMIFLISIITLGGLLLPIIFENIFGFKIYAYVYKQYAEQGYAAAQYSLGNCYCNGQGVTQDYKKAVELYAKAAEQGYTDAQYNLGVCYKNGEGVAQDYKKAVELYTKVAEQGDADAQCALAVCYENGEGVAQDIELAKKYFILAAKNGSERAKKACSRLGISY